MTHLPIPPQGARPAPLADEHDEQEKLVPTPVSLSSRIVADGSVKHDDGKMEMRMTLVVRPTLSSATPNVAQLPAAPTVNLRCWPSEVMKHFFDEGTAKIRVVSAKGLSGDKASPGGIPADHPNQLMEAKIKWRSDPEVADRVDRFWRRMMNPPPRFDANLEHTVWERMVQALTCPPPAPTSVVLPTPHGAAALAFTLERGRMVLSSLAGPDSPLVKHLAPSEEPNMARPWYQGERRVQVASLAPDIPGPGWGRTPQDEEYWLAPYRQRTAALLAGEVPRPIWPRPETFAQTVLAGGQPAADLREQIYAAHHVTTPANPVYPFCSNEDQALDTARRRLGALLSLPTLQRLLGFTFDLYVDADKFDDKYRNLGTDFILIRPELRGANGAAGANWTLVRYRPASGGRPAVFCPASWSEMTNPNEAVSTFGFRNLGAKVQGGPRYDIITVDAPLATEGSINHAARGQAKGSALSPAEGGVPVLHNGGLRVIELPEKLPLDTPNKRDISCEPSNVVQDADDLTSGDRLMIGVKVRSEADKKNVLLWRSPDYRIVEFVDPSSDVPHHWVEKELARRLLPAGSRRRLELDGGMAVPAAQTILDQAMDTDADTEKDPVLKGAIKMIVDCTVALWGSDPAGVPPPGRDRNGKFITDTKVAVIEELDVTRHFSVPSSKAGHHADALNPSLRFGWPYYTALARVFDGGACTPARHVGEFAVAQPSIALPQTNQYGRRFLRHERLNAPMSLILERDQPLLDRLKPPQRSGDMYVRTMVDAKHSVSSSRRLLVPPPVPLQFAMLHDVLRNLGANVKTPRQGLGGLALLGRPGDKLPTRVRVGTAHRDECIDSLYYPDPAASIIVLGLKLPQERGVDSSPLVEHPVAIPVGARTWPDADARQTSRVWPDILPIHIQLKPVRGAATLNNKDRINVLGPRWLAVGEKLLTSPTRGAVQVQAVEISLQYGEDLLLQAWCVPTVNQLADWFDAIEAAGVLAASDSPFERDTDAACVNGLIRLLDIKIPKTDRTQAAVAVCTGAGGLRAPSRPALLTLAGLVHRELLLRPVPALSSPLTTRLTHAIDDKLLPQPDLGPNLAVTRRLFRGGVPRSAVEGAPPDASKGAPVTPEGETPADFLNSVSALDWGLNSTQEGASGALFGGEVRFDPASTSGLIIEALSAAPFGDALDPETGRTLAMRLEGTWQEKNQDDKDQKGKQPAVKDVAEEDKRFGFVVHQNRSVDFERKRVVVLRFDGLPLPADGRAGKRKYSLQELMAGAWGAQRQFGDALRAALPAVFNGGGARRLWLHAIPVNRHAGLLPPPPKEPEKKKPADAKQAKLVEEEEERKRNEREKENSWDPSKTERFHVWLPATTRPSPPVIDHVSVALSLTQLKPKLGLDGTFTVGVAQSCSLMIWQARPFFSSGEGEMLALVLWPPGLFARGIEKDERGAVVFPLDSLTKEGPEFFDEDLGAGGKFVTRWGADPLTGDNVPSDKFPTGPLVDPYSLASGGALVPRAFMPVPVADQNWATSDAAGEKDTKNKDSKDKAPMTFLAVALQAFEPRFDPVEELWYINVPLRTDPLPFPRVRLGLVRYQPNAREDDLPLEGEEPVRLRVSAPVTEWAKPLPGRRATATCRQRADGCTEVIVTVDGPSAMPNDQAGANPDMVVEVIRFRNDGGLLQEETAKDDKGADAICKEWSSDALQSPPSCGVLRRVAAGLSWSCMFVLSGALQHDGWSHAVVVRETRELPKANVEDGDTERKEKTGPNFVARVELNPK